MHDFVAMSSQTPSELMISYIDSNGNESERKVSNIEVVVSENKKLFPILRAFCHLREAKRDFIFSRITQVVIPSTGEIIEDIYALFNLLPPIKTVQKESAKWQIDPDKVYSTQHLQTVRKYQKRLLFEPFCGIRVIEAFFLKKLFDLFRQRCFKCEVRNLSIIEPGDLDEIIMDHHLPIVLGGKLVPGNIVTLCRSCNSRKGDRHPKYFYSETELAELLPLLSQQEALFQFKFDRKAWSADKEKYLLEIGIKPWWVNLALHDSNHKYFIGDQEPLGYDKPIYYRE